MHISCSLFFFLFYILNCVLLKIFSPFCWTWFQLLLKQINLGKNAIFQISCFSHKKKTVVSHINLRKIISLCYNKINIFILLHTHVIYINIYIYIYYMWIKGVRKFKGLRFILVNSQIFNFFYGFCDNCCQTTKHE